MTTLKPQPGPAQTLAAWAWAAVALTPVGWFCGVLAIAYSHLGDVTNAGTMTGGVVLFVAAPTSAVILAVCAVRAGHRSGKVAVAVSGLVLLAVLAGHSRSASAVPRPFRERTQKPMSAAAPSAVMSSVMPMAPCGSSSA